jgi:preprotein translocase subunit SecG
LSFDKESLIAMQQVVLAVHLIAALLLIGLILLQRGKGSDIGAAFGSGASQTIFGSQGSASFLVKLVTILVGLFFVSSLFLNYLMSATVKQQQIANTPSVLLQQQQQNQSNNKQ